MLITDRIYAELLSAVKQYGTLETTRNSEVHTCFFLQNISFSTVPLVSLRKTQWKKAIREMEWFLSGAAKCPDELRNWWDGQLDEDGNLLDGYSIQLRRSYAYQREQDDNVYLFDQVKFIHEGLRNNPNSRRLLMTVWNPVDMAHITETNNNPNTPTCCHSIIVQFFVRGGTLHMKTYQRSVH